MENGKCIIVVADTHFGLRNEAFFEPEVFSSFLRWVKLLEKGEVEPLKLGNNQQKVLNPPEKIVMLGDVLELWDASDKSVDICARTITPLLSELKCEKVYLLGNHDDILYEIELYGKHFYPLGARGLRIINTMYPTQDVKEEGVQKVRTIDLGDEKYLFIHGQQFDSYFIEIGPAYRIIAYLREAAMAFGHFSWIFVILFFIGIILVPFRGLAPSGWMLLLLALLAVPRIFICFARRFYNAIKSTRYQRVDLDRFRAWWDRFSDGKEYPLEKLNVIYGHTHLMDIRYLKSPDIRLLNVPSWVKDERSRKIRENVLRAAFLYIDDEGSKFVGWDWVNSKPFSIPEKVIEMRRQGLALTDEVLSGIGWSREKLRNIGWPDVLLEEWEKPITAEELRRSRREALIQELRIIYHS